MGAFTWAYYGWGHHWLFDNGDLLSGSADASPISNRIVGEVHVPDMTHAARRMMFARRVVERSR